MININGKIDSSYRYKMPGIKSIINGRGNGIFTIITNLEEICKYINQPYQIILKYLSICFGSMGNETKMSITGEYTDEQLQKGLQKYIDTFVICPACNIPETIPLVKKESKKNITLELKCGSCGIISSLNCTNKIDSKIIDIIIKHLDKNEWTVASKGIMVSHESNKIKSFSTMDDDTINPFD
jgi:translation initiation factor 5